jgi:hypothetical protein
VLLQLPDVVEEAEHALLEQRRGALIEGGQAVVSEQVPVAGVQEQFQREPGIDDFVGQALSGEPVTLDDRVETDLPGAGNAGAEGAEGRSLDPYRRRGCAATA